MAGRKRPIRGNGARDGGGPTRANDVGEWRVGIGQSVAAEPCGVDVELERQNDRDQVAARRGELGTSLAGHVFGEREVAETLPPALTSTDARSEIERQTPSESRRERIARLSEAIDSGHFRVDAASLADAIVAAHRLPGRRRSD